MPGSSGHDITSLKSTWEYLGGLFLAGHDKSISQDRKNARNLGDNFMGWTMI